MRKITCLLLLIQFGFINAQTKTVVTQNGEKLDISPYANNGLSANNGFIQLGGALTKPSVLTTTSAFTLAIEGLQTGGTADNILVTDENGVLKTVARSSFAGADNLGNHIATQDLNMNSNNIASANDITATGKTSTGKAAIALGSDGNAPKPGDFATAADVNGNITWHTPSEAAPVGTAFFKYTLSTDISINAESGKIKFNKEIVDKSNVTSGKLVNNSGSYSVFTVPKTGYYAITVSVYQFLSSTTTVSARMFRGRIQLVDETTSEIIGTNEIYMYSIQPFYWSPQLITTINKLTAGQRVSVNFFNNFKTASGIAGNTNIAGDTASHPSISYLSGYFISE
ncbi:hypothetical protein [Flavobacterium sp. MDT1-60]|uniref:hypothetical protein n=1 Tax=Flavobacterium sp. MDT1-60 TaxID=1979344 RepID=UPI001784BE93|nr:hypothetical protein [Flavobacterium sp. MDT1-60]QOG02384.1 hypothetical protein IHE43_21810 [Flavobacterium sp. MDT1-60]